MNAMEQGTVFPKLHKCEIKCAGLLYGRLLLSCAPGVLSSSGKAPALLYTVLLFAKLLPTYHLAVALHSAVRSTRLGIPYFEVYLTFRNGSRWPITNS